MKKLQPTTQYKKDIKRYMTIMTTRLCRLLPKGRKK